MVNKKFSAFAVNENNKNWQNLIMREAELPKRDNDVRNPFERDYTRILHCKAYARLKHKTQVFFNIDNDHICTRIEHVGHVASVSTTIAKALGLNIDLTDAIALGHDLGHAPFGHHGESVLNELRLQYLGKSFWHEQNGLYVVDNVELLKNCQNEEENLCLTYAVRDGIVSHCGEIDVDALKPREDLGDLYRFAKAGTFSPATWEACVVKVSDKIAYIGRDIEDAISLHFLSEKDIAELNEIKNGIVNNTTLIHEFIVDIIENSDPINGIRFSKEKFEIIKNLKQFNYDHIYNHERLAPYRKYATLIIEQLFLHLLKYYDATNNCLNVDKLQKDNNCYPFITYNFIEWLLKYSDILLDESAFSTNRSLLQKNKKLYGKIDTQDIYVQAVLDFIAGMTDAFAIKCFNELMTFR